MKNTKQKKKKKKQANEKIMYFINLCQLFHRRMKHAYRQVDRWRDKAVVNLDSISLMLDFSYQAGREMRRAIKLSEIQCQIYYQHSLLPIEHELFQKNDCAKQK